MANPFRSRTPPPFPITRQGYTPDMSRVAALIQNWRESPESNADQISVASERALAHRILALVTAIRKGDASVTD